MENQQNHRQNEIERLLLENLKIAKENRSYIIKIDRRQRWARNWATFYWAVIVVAALFGYFYAFPYLQEARETLSSTWENVTSFAQPATKTE